MQIAKNELAIAEYKNDLAEVKKEQREEDEQKLAEMEARNEEMKADMKKYDGRENVLWNVFKADVTASIKKFDEDMTELGHSIEKKVQPNKK